MSFTKITWEESETLSEDEIISRLEPNIQEAIKNKLDYYKFQLVSTLIGSESPIERLLLLELNWTLEQSPIMFAFDLMASIETQKEIKCGDNIYRVDIFIDVSSETRNDGKRFIVECDGYEFHEKTKEQAKRDKERDRNLIKAGYTVIHFSGSEIVKNARNCADEVRTIILNSFK